MFSTSVIKPLNCKNTKNNNSNIIYLFLTAKELIILFTDVFYYIFHR